MRPDRFPFAILIVCLAVLAAGCSEKASRLTGNERLLRGGDGLGTTSISDTLVDRDTYVAPKSTTVRGATLLAGSIGAYESRSLFRSTGWTLPDTLAVVDTVLFRLEFDPRVDENLDGSRTFALHLAEAGWDTTTVEWPGPPLGTQLGTGDDGLAPFTIQLAGVTNTQLHAWAADPNFPGFVLSLDTGSGVRGFLAGTGRLEIKHHHTTADSAWVTSRLQTDLSIQTPAAAAAGTEGSLVLGGLFQSEAVLRAPIVLPPGGFSLNAARFVAHILAPSSPASSDTVEIKAYRIRNPWAEGVAADSVLGLDTAPLATLTTIAPTAGDSITIPIPVSVALQWAQDSTSNQGILLRVTNSFYWSEIQLGSRESANPPVLRLNITSPPPGRL